MRGRIGVGVIPRSRSPSDLRDELGLPSTDGGAIVASVTAGAAADRAGISAATSIVEFNGKTVKDNNELVGMVTRTTPGTTVPVKIVRDKKPMTLNVKVDELNLAQEQEQLAGGGSAARGRASAQPAQRAEGHGVRHAAPATSRRPSRASSGCRPSARAPS